MLSKLMTKLACKLGQHPQVIYNRVSGEYVRPEVWKGECSSCGAVLFMEREEEPMIAESERIQAAQPAPLPEDEDTDIVWEDTRG